MPVDGRDIPFARPLDTKAAEGRRVFEQHPSRRYSLLLPDLAVAFEAEYLHRDRHELHGELTVRCAFAGARTTEGILSAANFNFSSQRTRSEMGKYCGERSHAKDIDWTGLLEEFCLRISHAERYAAPDISLADVEPTDQRSRVWFVDRTFAVLKDHPMIWFAEGGSCKSFLALRLALQLASQGVRVLYVDWELTEFDHRNRLALLHLGAALPDIRYLHCDRPLVDDADRLLKIVKNRPIDYAIFDSMAIACAGRPEESEHANAYFRVIRQLGIGSLHLAHVTKGEKNDANPFGSIFFANNARSIWYLARTKDVDVTLDDGAEFTVGFFHKKATDRRLEGVRGYRLRFEGDTRLEVQPTDIRENQELADKIPLRQRLQHRLRRGAESAASIAESLGIEESSVRTVLARNPQQFQRLGDGRIGLVDRVRREES